MVGAFAGLKWRLVTSLFRATDGPARTAVIAGFVVAIMLIGLLTVGIAALRLAPAAAEPVVVALFCLQLVGWMLTPLLAFGTDETLDPARFALLPIRPHTLQRGLLVSSLIGYLPAANAAVLVGAATAVGVPWSMMPIAVLCAAVQLITCAVLSRAAATSMAALMTGRRGRDLGMAIGLAVFPLYIGLIAVINTGAGGGLLAGGLSVTSLLEWTPPGALAALPQLVASGQTGRAVLAAATAVVTLALAWWWWSAGLRRSLTSTPSVTAGSAPAGRGKSGRAVAAGTGGTALVVAGRDRVLAWRDPMRRLPWLLIAFLTVAWPFLMAPGRGAVFGVALGALSVGQQAVNLYGIEGSGLWLHLQTVNDRVRARGEVLGHAAATVIPGTGIVLAAVAIHAVWRSDYANIPAALGVCLAAVLGSTAAACYLSAALPYAVPQSRTSLFASSVPGHKGRAFAVSLAVFAGGAVVALPAALCAWLSIPVPVWGWAALVAGAGVGIVALWFAAGVTADRYLDRAPDIYATVAAGDRA